MTLPIVVQIGADPELFAKIGVDYISVHEALPGTKWEPFKVYRGAVQVDGVAAEFNIDPARRKTDFIRSIKTVRKSMLKMLQKRWPSAQLVADPTAYFEKNYFSYLPESVRMLGCEPDFSAYTRKANPKPHTDEPIRTGSGHIHIGWDDDSKKTEDNIVNLVKDLDYCLAPQALKFDNDVKRMELYGQRGSFRPKPYGVEYRVLSNAWLRSDKTIGFVFDASKAIAEYSLNNPQPLHEAGVESTLSFEDFLHSKGIPVL